jgi:flagellar protein FlgJ
MLNFDPSINGLAADPKALNELKRRAQSDEEGALRAAAKQFEVLLLDLVMKSMRANAPGETELDNEGTRLFTSLLDQEFTRSIAQKGGLGLADLMVKQLSQAHRLSQAPDQSSASAASRMRAGPGQETAPAADSSSRTSGAA